MGVQVTDRGAHFRRCDFQVHTPRDARWAGPRPVSAEDRRTFAERLVAACRAKQLNAIAVTDHHDFVFAPYIKEAAAAETDSAGHLLSAEQRLVVFPGMELTLGVPCQALLLLDPDFPDDRLDGLLHRLGLEVTDPAQPALGQVVPLGSIDSLRKLQEHLDEVPWLKGRYIVLPNVSDGGRHTLLRAGGQHKYKDMPCVGGYVDGSISTLGTGNAAILAGQDSNWGNKALAVFQTSDSRSDRFEALGLHSTWVKWAKPSAEALRQACLARESRVAQGTPALPNLFVTRLSVSNSRFMGPIEIELNAQYNAVIGGRGTGKSTLLEYIRWALCDQQFPKLGPDDELLDLAARQRRLIKSTLAELGAHVDVHLSINGIDHVVRRDAASGSCQIKVAHGDFAPAREADVRALLPIHSYSQKQLSSVAIRLDELIRFVTAPIQSRLDAVDERLGTVAARLRQNYAGVERYKSLQHIVGRLSLTEESLRQQAENLRQSLGNLSEDDQAVLQRKPLVDRADEAVQAWERRLAQASEAAVGATTIVDGLIAGAPGAPSDATRQTDLAALEVEVKRLLTDLRDAIATARAGLDAARRSESHMAAVAGWTQEREDFATRYEGVKAASAAHESKLDELASIEIRQREAQQQLTDAEEELAGLGDPVADHGKLRAEWRSISDERTELLAQQCLELTRLSGGQVRAELRPAQGLTEAASRLRAAVTGSGVRGSVFDDFFSSLSTDANPVESWDTALAELEKLIGSDADAALATEAIPTLARLGFKTADVKKMIARLTPDGWLDIALAPIADHPSFGYRRKAGEHIDFADASAGQRATALLHILLNQSGPPLLVDQPEEDLDSQVVQQIVTATWAAKSRRQIVFASHNANLVVNGDAELVLCCDYRAVGDQSGGQVKLQGAIDVEAVREEITRVMEGGEKAFRLRKDKYGF